MSQKVQLTVVAGASGDAVTAAFRIPSWAKHMKVLTPTLTSGDVGLAMSMDGTNYYPMVDPNLLTAITAVLVEAANSTAPAWADFSFLGRGVPELAEITFKFTYTTGTGGNFHIYFTNRIE